MTDWRFMLSILVWIGPLAVTPLFFLFEKLWPRAGATGAPIPWLNLKLGLFALAVTVVATALLHGPIVEIMYAIQILSVAESNWPAWLQFLVSFLLIDFMVWLNHLATHKIGWLWRIHRVHHSDEAVRASTGLLRHPLEAVWLFCSMLSAYVFFGVTITAILAYGLATVIHSPFSHANIALPAWLDRMLAFVVITPSVHRIHHSIDPSEENSNYGAILPFWDRMFRTYRSRAQCENFPTGVVELKISRDRPLMSALTSPFFTIA